VKSYDYARRQGVLEISWDRFAVLARRLAEALAPARPEAVIGIARAGLIPAGAVAAALRVDLLPVRLSRREADRVVRDHPVWSVDLSPQVAGRRVVVVDEIADTGETLALAARRARELGARSATTAVLAAHTWADPAPDHAALVSDALVVFPWDRSVLVDGRWEGHPEIAEALQRQSAGAPDARVGAVDEEMIAFVRETMESRREQAGQAPSPFPFRSRFGHSLRVWKWARRLQAAEGGSREIVEIAALFHDVAKESGVDHARVGARICRDYLLSRGYDSGLAAAVARTVETHSHSRARPPSLSLEQRLVRDADLLDEVGVLTVLWDSLAVGAGEDASYLEAYRRIADARVRLEGGWERLHTATAIVLFRERLEVLDTCLAELRFELGLE
jgi:hypoxanthine phosphoribosyltransferase/HD superfamily phosphodiesterase